MSLKDRLADALERSLYRLMQWLPTERVSAIGSFMVRQNVKINRPFIIEGARKNLKTLRPDMPDAEVEAAILRFLDNVGRFMAEFTVLDRLIPEGRVEVRGIEHMAARQGRAPTVAIALHTGNWEVFGPSFQQHGVKVATFYEYPETEFQREVAESTRKRFGFALLTPDLRGLRDALGVLKENGIVAIFGDEARHAKTMAPLFGRPPHASGNLAIAAKLARKSGAGIIISHCERIGACRFRLHHSEALHLPDTTGRPDMLADVAFLNARIEPIIRAHLDRWYFLDDSIEPFEAGELSAG